MIKPAIGQGRLLVRAVLWDLRLQARYQIATVAVAAACGYAVMFRAVPATRTDEIAVLLVFSDPTTIGFLFVGVLVLFEKQAGTLQAVAVSPLSAGLYLWSKAISLSVLALVSSLLIAVASHGTGVRILSLLAGTALTSMFLVFIGFVAVARVRSINEYLLIVPLYLIPVTLPLVSLAGLDRPVLYLFPTSGSLLLMQGAFGEQSLEQTGYAVLILAAAVTGTFWLARRAFEQYVRGPGRV